jgi:sugar phosphate isomerase/epimerase
MFTSLSPGAIGIRNASLSTSIGLAKLGGFAGLDFSIVEAAALARKQGVQSVRDLFDQAGVRPASWGLPVDWRGDDARLDQGLLELPDLAAISRGLGCDRVFTWILPGSDERPFAENFDWHVRRFRRIARVLAEEGCRIGLEFVGPKTSRTSRRFEFVYTLEGMLELARSIGTGNVGILLDAWHLYTTRGTPNDVLKLRGSDVVTVHVNDAPLGVDVDAQVDSVRCLPLETGVIDLTGFLRALQTIGYDGPVTPEPFSKSVNELPPEEAVRVTGETMRQAWEAAGIE